MWESLFGATNLVAAVGWFALLALPRRPALLAAILYLGVALLCLTYTILFIGLLGGLLDPVRQAGALEPDFAEYSVRTVMALFSSRGGVVLGWTHYLAFDLYVGLWIARDADAKGFSRIAQGPVLLATFVAGPIGLFLWLLVRERRARAQGRRQ